MKLLKRGKAKEILGHDELIICVCPDWCEEGYMVAKYNHSDMLFEYDGDPNGSFDDYVTGFYRAPFLNQ